MSHAVITRPIALLIPSVAADRHEPSGLTGGWLEATVPRPLTTYQARRPENPPGLAAAVRAMATARTDEAGRAMPAGRYDANEPVYKNHPDPGVVRADDGYYYSYATNARRQDRSIINMPVIRSRDLLTWEDMGDAMPTVPAGVSYDLWAPDVQRTGDHYTALYSGRSKTDDDRRMIIGYATSDTPAGPFVDRGVLFQPRENTSATIDAQLYTDKDGQSYILWGSGDKISTQPISIGKNGTITRTGDAPDLLQRNMENVYEHSLIEAPWMEEHDGTYYLYYSAGNFDDTGPGYAVFVARSDSPLGPFEKQGTPILATEGGMRSPGHMSITRDDAGRSWMLHHAFTEDRSQGRVLMVREVTYGPDGWPRVEGLDPADGELQRAPTIDPPEPR